MGCEGTGCDSALEQLGMRTLRVLVGLILISTALSAWAVKRHFPRTAMRGTVEFLGDRGANLNGESARIAVGARVWDQRNSSHIMSYYTGNKAEVNYTLNHRGEIDRIWILSDTEAQQTPEEQKIQPKQN